MPPTFAQLGVPQYICTALARRGVTRPFEIQAATLADALAGHDVCGRAPTGSGKTIAFGIPLVAAATRSEPRRPRALVLAPTRELAEQIGTEIRSFSGRTRVASVYGGVGYGPQLAALRQGVDILVACPGRLEDLIERGDVRLSAVEQVVIDEADRMADMGFMPAVRRLLDQTPSRRQTMLFSATLDGDVAKLTRDHQRDPVRHEVGTATPDITAASHVFWTVAKPDRAGATADAVNAVWPAIVFCRTRHGSDRLAKQLGRAGIEAAAIHGGRNQSQRSRALASFASGRVQALVATDVAARGIHVDGVASVIHYDPPEDHKAYTHRSGRTARAGDGGVVVSLVQPDQQRDLRRLQRRLDLDEPFTAPDAHALRSLSPTPGRRPGRTDGRQPASDEAGTRPRPPRRRRNGNGAGQTHGNKTGQKTGNKTGKKSGNKTGRAQSGKQAHRSGGRSQRPNRKARRAHLQPR